MSLKTVLLVAASVLIASPELAAAKSKSSDPIVNHSGGPISYAELQQLDQGSAGYNSRGGRHHKRQKTSAAPDSTAAPSSTGVDTSAPAAPAAPPAAAPDASAAPAPSPSPSPDAAPPPAATTTTPPQQ
jgi:hypothetical protein